MLGKQKHKIRAKSHILSLLGEELIGSDSLAIFELVKNSYDADAENVHVKFLDLNTPKQKIIIEDDGNGMSTKTLSEVWLTIGTDFKRGKNRKISPRFGRVSFGNKGIGRLAVHKLAKEIELQTKQNGDLFSNRLKINWPNLITSKEYIQELEVEVETIGEGVFEKGHGTKITLSELTTKKWSKRSFRELVRKIENIQNPFVRLKNNFKVTVSCNDFHDEWIQSIKTPKEILENCLYHFKFDIKKTSNEFVSFSYKYKFNPPKNILKNGINKSSKKYKQFFIGDIFKGIDGNQNNKHLRDSDIENIGEFSGEFFIFNQNSQILAGFFPGQISAIKNYIKENKGIKLYRDNLRVYNYGEPSDDWLNLDLDKIQHAGSHFGKKVSLGYVSLDLSQSENGLVEKTNREGFIENYIYLKFQTLVKYIFNSFERIALEDKETIDELLEGFKPIKKIGFGDSIKELESAIVKKNLEKELSPLVKKIERDYGSMRDIMVNSGMTGLNLGVAFHEVEREIKYISLDLDKKDIKLSNIKSRVGNLLRILESLSPLLRKNKSKITTAFAIIETSKKLNQNRFGYHDVIFSSPTLTDEAPNFKIKGPVNLLIGALSNIIDNSLYWTGAERDLNKSKRDPAILVTTDTTTYNNPAIIICDNGQGFTMEPEYLTQPFKTKKDNGMGLGLYFVDLVMQMTGGRLVFPDIQDLNIPNQYNGACIALIFPKIK